MNWHSPSRLAVGAALVLLCAVTPAHARFRQQRPLQFQAAIRQNRPAPPRNENRPGQNGARAAQNQEHLQQWMENHKSLSPADQRRALQNEPGFRELPPQVQERELNNLDRLNNMNPQQRDRTLERNEILERMTPAQVQQYHGAVQTFAGMAPERRRVMARAILDLREMPPEQREQVINSPRFGAQFSDGERSTINTLLSVEPYPPVRSASPPQ
jgi:hypothetical protein